jgi:nucleoside-diphosphate-sugar epimerase
VTRATGWKPKRAIEQTVEEVARWLADHRAQLEPILTQ